MKPHRATLVLVLGILGLILCQPLGVVAWVLGGADLKEMAAGTMDPAGRDLTNIGRILGIVASILLVLGLLVFLAIAVISVIGSAGAAAMSQ
jgi:hypothetical protein